MRRSGLRGLRAEASSLHLQLGCLLLDVDALLLAALLVGGTLAQIVLPAHVVDIDDLPVGIQIEHAVDGLAHELDIVTDHNEPALVVLKKLAQPNDAVRVEVVGRLIKDHRVGIREENAGELDAASLSTRKGAQGLFENAVGQRKVVRNRCGLGLSGIAAERFEPLSERPIATHRGGCDIRIAIAHGDRRLVHANRQLAEAARVENAGACKVFGVATARILRQVADLARALNLAVGRQQVTGEDLGERGLAGTITPDKAHLVARANAERDVRHEYAGAHADFKIVHGKHSKHPFNKEARKS